MSGTATKGLTAALAAAAIALGSVAPGAAQDNQAPSGQQQPPAQLSEQALKSFAAAAVEVQRISDSYQSELRSTQDSQESQQLRQEIQGEMVDAVKDQGLTLEQYNRIYKMAQSNPRLQQMVLNYMQEVE